MSAKEYLAKMPGTDPFLALSQEEQDKWIFLATETLNDHLASRQITDRVIALQTIFEFEGDQEDVGMLRRQGIESFQAEGISMSVKSGSIAPKVMDIVNRKGRAGVGSII
jgi:hypothetical protein